MWYTNVRDLLYVISGCYCIYRGTGKNAGIAIGIGLLVWTLFMVIADAIRPLRRD